MFLFRPDGHQNNLRSAAYEALMEIVKNSAKDCYPAVQKTTLVIMERLQQVLQMEVCLLIHVWWLKPTLIFLAFMFLHSCFKIESPYKMVCGRLNALQVEL